jgi:hypothetical protein
MKNTARLYDSHKVVSALKERVACSVSETKHINTLCGQNEETRNVKASGTSVVRCRCTLKFYLQNSSGQTI